MRKVGETMKKISVVLDDDELYTTLKIQAAKSNRKLKEIICEALEEWLKLQEDLEDAAFAREAMVESGENIPWENIKGEMRLRLKARESLRTAHK